MDDEQGTPAPEAPRKHFWQTKELWIVVATVGVIAAIAVPNLIEARKHGNEAAAIGADRLAAKGG